jgi:putative AlgH/UPF0301 family transcriptional regulator
MTDLADPRASHVVLIGASAYRHLDPLPAVRENVRALAEVLKDRDLWGIAESNCSTIVDTAEPASVSRVLRTAAQATTGDGLFLVYYAGHGLIDPDKGTLVLAMPDCEPDVPDEAGLPYEWIGRAMRAAPARRRVVVLDCCYAGRASAEMAGQSTASGVVADKAEIDETCLLVSARRDRAALSPEGEQFTAFTGELVRILKFGLVDRGEVLTVSTVWKETSRALVAKGRERPELRERNAGGAIALVRNAAASHHDLSGSILVANRGVADPDLHEAAILVLRHNETGAIGVRLTRSTGRLPEDLSQSWRPLLAEPGVVFDGGPVARDGYIAVAMLRRSANAPIRFSPLRGRLGTISLSSPPEGLNHTFTGVRIFSGYLGWKPGELERYVKDRVLTISAHTVGAVFSAKPHELWSSG